MKDILKNIIKNVLIALYEPFGFAVILAVLFMFVYMFAREQGIKNVVGRWWNSFRTHALFRCVFFLVFYTAMILFRTLLNRYMWANPVSNVIGIWGLYDENGVFTTQAIENFILFIPFTVLLLLTFRQKLMGASVRFLIVLWKSVTIVFMFSLAIEFLQLFFRLGTFQLSDLFYNTLGGLVGGLIYWVLYKIWLRKK